MIRGEGACLVCGKSIVYYPHAKEMECIMCHKKYESYASCEDGHYVCDNCHAEKGIQVIMEGCREMDLRDPILIMQKLMENPYIYMHGPEHHIMVGAALLTAFYNSGGYSERGGKTAFNTALEEMKDRGREYPGGSCGYWGCCGAAVSTGMFISIITKATPLTGKSWGNANLMTSKALEAIARLGGPRCCKRNSFTAAAEAVKFVKENLGVEMELSENIKCNFSEENQQCLKRRCPYNEKGTT